MNNVLMIIKESELEYVFKELKKEIVDKNILVKIISDDDFNIMLKT